MTDVLTLLVPQGSQASLAQKAAEALALRPQVVALELRTPEDEQFAADVRAHLKQRLKDNDAGRKSVTVHLDAAKKAVDAQYRPEREALEGLVSLIDAKLSECETKRRAMALSAQRSATALAAAGHLARAANVLAIVEAAEKPVGLTYVDTWEHKRVDLMALVEAVAAGRAPIEFLMLDNSAVKIWLRTYKDSTECPPVEGLEFARVSKPRAYAGG